MKIINIEKKEIIKAETRIIDDAPKYLKKEEAHQIILNVPNNKYKDKMFIMFLWNTGLRVSEAIKIRKQDIDFVMKNIKVIWLKRRVKKNRIIPINDKFAYQLSLYCGNMNKSERLFDFSRHRAYQITKKYGEKIRKDIHPHLFRHGFAVNYLKQTNDLIGLKKLLGHVDIRNTVIYTKIVNADVREKLNKIDF